MNSIPYDPALVLGMIVDDKLLTAVLAVSAAGAPADKAHDELNNLILSKRSIDMTIQELTGMGIDAGPVIKASGDLAKAIQSSAVAFATATITGQAAIVAAKGARAAVPVSKSIESPLDWTKSKLLGVNISADTFNMDAQYFNNDENSQGSSASTGSISAYVSASTSFMGSEYSGKATAAVSSAHTAQTSKHSIAGTLVITAGATHKGAQLFAPLVMDPDRTVRVWNQMFPGKKLDIMNPGSMAQALFAAGNDAESLQLLSGATYGSSFVGMVHILNVTSTSSSESVISVAQSCQATMKVASWFAASGGESSSFTNNVKTLLSASQIQAHCSLVTMGLIPSIKSNDGPKIALNFLKNDNPMEQANALSANTTGQVDTISSAVGANSDKTKLIDMKCASVTSTIGALQSQDEASNRMIDINSMITAFDDYVQKAGGAQAGGGFGVPINYYLKTLNRQMVALMWMAKYYPEQINITETDQQAAGTQKASA